MIMLYAPCQKLCQMPFPDVNWTIFQHMGGSKKKCQNDMTF
jgi:hypothetical protein